MEFSFDDLNNPRKSYIIKELMSIGGLEDDWDGEGAEAPSDYVLEKTQEILFKACEESDSWHDPFITVHANGIDIKWDLKSRLLLIISDNDREYFTVIQNTTLPFPNEYERIEISTVMGVVRIIQTYLKENRV